MTDSVETAIAVLGSELRGHVVSDQHFQTSMSTDISEIKTMIRDMTTEFKTANVRLHTRIDDEAGRNSATRLELEDKISAQKIWTLSGVIAGMGALITMGIDFMWNKH